MLLIVTLYILRCCIQQRWLHVIVKMLKVFLLSFPMIWISCLLYVNLVILSIHYVWKGGWIMTYVTHWSYLICVEVLLHRLMTGKEACLNILLTSNQKLDSFVTLHQCKVYSGVFGHCISIWLIGSRKCL
jgi:hypothetical protein